MNIGAGGTARNTASTPLVECVVEVTGTVWGTSYSGRETRTRLVPGATWGWEVAFGSEAGASDDDSDEDLAVETRAAYGD